MQSAPDFPLHPEAAELLGACRSAGFYRAAGTEANIDHWLEWCDGRGVSTALPRLASREAAMEFAIWRPEDDLTDSGMGFEQPSASVPVISPELVCVPILGFDRHMNRIGQGAGHYDGYFVNNVNMLRIGIAWSIQELPEIEFEDWDIPMDAVCTEKAWICPPHSRIVTR